MNILSYCQLDISKIDRLHNKGTDHTTRIEQFPVTRDTCTLPCPDNMPAWLEFRLICACGTSHTMSEEDKKKCIFIAPPKEILDQLI